MELFWHQMGYRRVISVLAKSRIAPCPKVSSILRRSSHAQDLFTSGPKRLIAPRERRRDDESGPGSAKRVFAKTTHLRQMASAFDVSDPGMELAEQGRDQCRFRDREFKRPRPQKRPPRRTPEVSGQLLDVFLGRCGVARGVKKKFPKKTDPLRP